MVSESSTVQRAWDACCQARDGGAFDGDPEVLKDIFHFSLRKFHNCRMGDYTWRISRISSISKDQGSLALRSHLKACKKDTEASSTSALGTGARTEGGGGGSVGGIRPVGRSRLPLPELTVAAARSMSQGEVERYTREALVALLHTLGVTANNKPDLVKKVFVCSRTSGGRDTRCRS